MFDLPNVPEHYVSSWALFQSPGHPHGTDGRLVFRIGGLSDDGRERAGHTNVLTGQLSRNI